MKKSFFVCYVLKQGSDHSCDFRNGVFEIEPPPKKDFWRWEEEIKRLAHIEIGRITIVSFQEM